MNHLDKQLDINPAWGGPIIQDKLWFYNAFRYDSETDYVAGLFDNATPTAWTYTPSTQQAGNTAWDRSSNLRLTWQASQNNRIGVFFDAAPHCTCDRGSSATASPESTQVGIFWPNYFSQAVWRFTPTSRLLIEAGAGSSWGSFQYNRQPGVAPDTIAVTEQSTGLSYRANTTYGQNPTNPKTVRFAVTYVTGSHAAKFGISDVFGHNIAWLLTPVLDTTSASVRDRHRTQPRCSPSSASSLRPSRRHKAIRPWTTYRSGTTCRRAWVASTICSGTAGPPSRHRWVGT